MFEQVTVGATLSVESCEGFLSSHELHSAVTMALKDFDAQSGPESHPALRIARKRLAWPPSRRPSYATSWRAQRNEDSSESLHSAHSRLSGAETAVSEASD